MNLDKASSASALMENSKVGMGCQTKQIMLDHMPMNKDTPVSTYSIDSPCTYTPILRLK